MCIHTSMNIALQTMEPRCGPPTLAPRSVPVECSPPARIWAQRWGILGTPVVDPTTNTIFLMPYILENGQPSYR